MIIWPSKGPTEVEDFAFEFADVLEAGETISSRTVIPDGVTVNSSAIVGSQVQAWLSAGLAGSVAKVTCTITTSASRTYSEVAVLAIGGSVIDLATAKAAQKIDGSDEDVLLGGFLRAAIGHIERRSGKNLTSKIVTQTVDGFPMGALGPIRLWQGPVSEILSVKYDDAEGVEQTLASFRLIEGGTSGSAKLLPAYSASWPATAFGAGSVRVTYVAGYDPTALPPELTQAAILLFGHFNANREAVVAGSAAQAAELPLGVEAMISPYCSPGIS